MANELRAEDLVVGEKYQGRNGLWYEYVGRKSVDFLFRTGKDNAYLTSVTYGGIGMSFKPKREIISGQYRSAYKVDEFEVGKIYDHVGYLDPPSLEYLGKNSTQIFFRKVGTDRVIEFATTHVDMYKYIGEEIKDEC